jgi:phenylpropionate dioxygenase-like ring-hydroxylating dioxygenase large terminal subunit
MSTDELLPGEAREIGPSLYDQLRADPIAPPDALLEESYSFRGDEDVPYTVYTSTEYAEREFDLMWSRTWQWACHIDHLSEAGDYYVYDVGPHSALIVRGADGQIRAFYNACMHRGTQLKPPGTCGFSNTLRCPFHGWEWKLDGSFNERPGAWDFPHVTDDSHRLPEMSVDVWEGFVFVNFDPNAEPLLDYLGVMPRHWADWGLADRYIETFVRKRLPCNWKAAAEAFLEAYHVRETHSTGELGDEVTTAYDIFEPNVSRFIHTTGLNSPLRNPPRTEQELAGAHHDAPGSRHTRDARRCACPRRDRRHGERGDVGSHRPRLQRCEPVDDPGLHPVLRLPEHVLLPGVATAHGVPLHPRSGIGGPQLLRPVDDASSADRQKSTTAAAGHQHRHR